jgi:hypothetical protein
MRTNSVPLQPVLSTDARRSFTPVFGSGKLEYFHCASNGAEVVYSNKEIATNLAMRFMIIWFSLFSQINSDAAPSSSRFSVAAALSQ